MSESKPTLSEKVELDRSVLPAEVLAILRDAVELAWKRSGNDARCNVYATWLGWLLQEHRRATDSRDELATAMRRLLATINVRDAETHGPDCRCVIHEARAAIARAEAR